MLRGLVAETRYQINRSSGIRSGRLDGGAASARPYWMRR